MPFIAAFVPTGMYTGVDTSPWERDSKDARALLEKESIRNFRGHSTVNFIFFTHGGTDTIFFLTDIEREKERLGGKHLGWYMLLL